MRTASGWRSAISTKEKYKSRKQNTLDLRKQEEEEIVHDVVATHFNTVSKINCDKNIPINLKQI